MKLAIVIWRKPEYRLCGPIIEAALARGWDVECWHNYHEARTGYKAYQFPWVEAVPSFHNGRPVVRSFAGRAELRTWLEDCRADAVISTESLQHNTPLPQRRPLCVGLQYVFDSFLADTPATLLNWDRFAAYSAWWLRWGAAHYEAEGLAPDGAAWLREMRRRTMCVGLPEVDGAASIDPAEVRARWGIPQDKPVVVLFPFPQGVGHAAFWPRHIFAEPNPIKQLARVVRHRRFEYLPDVRRRWTDRSVVTALRAFCDRSGACLVIKSRLKTPIPAYAEALGDKCVYDESYFPATVLEALSIASLSVSYFSSSVLESAALGVPHLCLTMTSEDYLGANRPYFSRMYSTDEGSAFQFRGVVTAWSIPDALRRLPVKTLDDFHLDRDAHGRYVREFLTAADGNGSERILDALVETPIQAHTGLD